MKRSILIIYLIFLFLFTINILNRPDPQPISIPSLQFFTDNKKNAYVLPRTPILFVRNNTVTERSMNTCEHLTIREMGEARKIPEHLCEIITINTSETVPIFGHTEEHMMILQKYGKKELEFTLTYQEPDEENAIDIQHSIRISLKQAGMVRLFFRHIFFQPVYNLFIFLIEALPGHSLGLAIIIITIIIRILLLAPQNKIMISQQRMQAIQPKIQAIQKQYKGDQAALGMKIMELYRKEKVNPFGSFLPLLLQIPILIVLYQTILGITNVTNHYHLYNFEFLQQFRDATINGYFLNMDLLASGGTSGIILALVVGAVQFVQMKLSQIRHAKTQAPKKKDEIKEKKDDEPNMPDMAQITKIMVYFLPIMVAFFTYQFPAGIGLYWLIGTLFMIVQQIFVNKQFKQTNNHVQVLDQAGKTIG